MTFSAPSSVSAMVYVELPMQYTLFMILAPLAATVSIWVAIYSWRRRAAQGALALAGYMLVISGWLIFNTLELVTGSEAATLFWAKITYIFISTTAVAWLAITFQYTDQQKWLAPSRFALLCIIPVMTILLAQTNEMHGLIWQSYAFFPVNDLLSMRVTSYGPWFWFFGAYSYILAFLGAGMLIKGYFKSFKLYRQQSIWLVIGALTPLILNIIYVFRLIPGFRKDYSSLSFAFAGVAFAIGIFRYRLFDLKPIARNALIDSMNDAMLVLNNQGRIVDLNPAAQAMIGASGDEIIGQPAVQVLSMWIDLVERVGETTAVQTDIAVGQGGAQRYFDLQISPLSDRRGHQTGRLVVLRDSTERVQAEKERERLIEELQEALAQVKTLSGLLPICAACKKIRDDTGYWQQVEVYIEQHSGAEFTHSICPDCSRKLYPRYYQ